eukprot:30672-Pelagococcus_subviridis.AAC.4
MTSRRALGRDRGRDDARKGWGARCGGGGEARGQRAVVVVVASSRREISGLGGREGDEARGIARGDAPLRDLRVDLPRRRVQDAEIELHGGAKRRSGRPLARYEVRAARLFPPPKRASLSNSEAARRAAALRWRGISRGAAPHSIWRDGGRHDDATMPRAAAALASSFAFEDTPEARLRAALLRAKTAEAEVAALRDENESLRHELAVMMATTTTTAQTRCQPCARRAANAAPVASPSPPPSRPSAAEMFEHVALEATAEKEAAAASLLFSSTSRATRLFDAESEEEEEDDDDATDAVLVVTSPSREIFATPVKTRAASATTRTKAPAPDAATTSASAARARAKVDATVEAAATRAYRAAMRTRANRALLGAGETPRERYSPPTPTPRGRGRRRGAEKENAEGDGGGGGGGGSVKKAAAAAWARRRRGEGGREDQSSTVAPPGRGRSIAERAARAALAAMASPRPATARPKTPPRTP